MKNSRREFIKLSAVAGAVSLAPKTANAAAPRARELAAKLKQALSAPVLRTEFFKQPVKLEGIELLKNGRQYLVRARATDGATGLAVANPAVLNTAYPILLNRVAPFFAGKDARDLDALIDGVYVDQSNYKWQGLPFWSSVAAVEFAVLDLLGQIAAKPLGELLGGIVRQEIAVYRASEKRGNSAEEEIAYLQQLVAESGAKAIKFRLGGRMRYDATTTKRDKALIALTRKTFGDRMTIYADANGSYDVPMAIQIGKLMQDYKLNFLEEPCPFDYYDETKEIADALALPIAGGECESSLRRFRWLIEHNAVQIVQPDLIYFGGLIRSIRVARMAAAAKLDCTAHMSGGGLGYLYVVHFASCVPNAGPFQEYKGVDRTLPIAAGAAYLKSENGMSQVPNGPGLGVTVDPAFVSKATILSA